MRGDKKSTEAIAPGSIVQINPAAQLAQGNGQLAVVVTKESWGCTVALPDGSVVRASWTHLGTTGGAVVWNAAGELVRPQEEPLRHHP